LLNVLLVYSKIMRNFGAKLIVRATKSPGFLFSQKELDFEER